MSSNILNSDYRDLEYRSTVNPAIDPDFAFETAYDLGAISEDLNFNESVGGIDKGDIYRFEITAAGQYGFSIENPDADIQLYIVNSEGNSIYNISNSASANISGLNLGFSEGTYYAVFISPSGAETDYSVNISYPSNSESPAAEVITPPIDPGNSGTADAFNLGTVSGTVVVKESVGALGAVADPGDSYRFVVEDAGEYSLKLDGLNADANLYLYDPNDTDSQGNIPPFELSESPGTASESIAVDLNAGEYYVAVNSADNQFTEYELTISDGSSPSSPGSEVEVIIPPSDPSYNGLANAFDLGIVSGTVVVEESVGALGTIADPGDLYRFVVENAGEYSFDLDGLSADANLYLYDPSNPNYADSQNVYPFAGSELPGTASESIAVDLNFGEYFIAVGSADNRYTEYELTISDGSSPGSPGTTAEVIIPPSDPSYGDLSQAFNLGTVTGTVVVEESVGASGVVADPGDLYRFVVEDAGEYSFNLDGLSADANLYLYDPTDPNYANSQGVSPFTGSELTGTASEAIAVDLNLGEYFIAVASIDNQYTEYELTISGGEIDTMVFLGADFNSGIETRQGLGMTLDRDIFAPSVVMAAEPVMALPESFL